MLILSQKQELFWKRSHSLNSYYQLFLADHFMLILICVIDDLSIITTRYPIFVQPRLCQSKLMLTRSGMNLE